MLLKIFSYNEYIKCIHTLRLNAVLQLAEENAKYNIEKGQVNNYYDKLIKNILKDKEEVAKFINEFMDVKEKINSDCLLKYTNSYINRKYKSKKSNIVYKLKNREIYFLIEHQSSVDTSMPYRILNYCIDIIQEWCKDHKNRKINKYPIIVPIVIYTGNKTWKVPVNFKDKQIGTLVFERYKINLEYNLIDVNKLTDEKLLKENSMLGCAMLIEKSKNKEELRKNLEKIINNIKNKEILEELSNIIIYLLNYLLKQTEQEELIDKIDRKAGEESVSNLYNRLLEENKRILKQGKMEGVYSVIKNMLVINLDDETIMQATKIKKEELEKIKKEMKVV